MPIAAERAANFTTFAISPALQQRLSAAEAERERPSWLIEQAEAGPRQTIDDVLARCRRQALEQKRVLDEDADRDRTRQLLADILGPVLIDRDADTGATWAEMEKPAERLALNGFLRGPATRVGGASDG